MSVKLPTNSSKTSHKASKGTTPVSRHRRNRGSWGTPIPVTEPSQLLNQVIHSRKWINWPDAQNTSLVDKLWKIILIEYNCNKRQGRPTAWHQSLKALTKLEGQPLMTTGALWVATRDSSRGKHCISVSQGAAPWSSSTRHTSLRESSGQQRTEHFTPEYEVCNATPKGLSPGHDFRRRSNWGYRVWTSTTSVTVLLHKAEV